MNIIRCDRGQSIFELLVVVGFIVILFCVGAAEMSKRRWNQACEWTDTLNTPSVLSTLRSKHGTGSKIDETEVLIACGARPSEFRSFQNSASTVKIYILPTLPPAGQPISVAVKGEMIYPNLLPEWEMSRYLRVTVK